MRLRLAWASREIDVPEGLTFHCRWGSAHWLFRGPWRLWRGKWPETELQANGRAGHLQRCLRVGPVEFRLWTRYYHALT